MRVANGNVNFRVVLDEYHCFYAAPMPLGMPTLGRAERIARDVRKK